MNQNAFIMKQKKHPIRNELPQIVRTAQKTPPMVLNIKF